jgi:DNA-binding transcriptional regulator YiaG
MSPSHPNRSRRSNAPGRNPDPTEVLALRERCQMTQTEFADLIYATRDTVAKWESGERRMSGALYEYACLLESAPEVRLARERWLDSWRVNHGP